jgi:imidazole glycerol-phosphate synthase subunit HisH
MNYELGVMSDDKTPNSYQKYFCVKNGQKSIMRKHVVLFYKKPIILAIISSELLYHLYLCALFVHKTPTKFYIVIAILKYNAGNIQSVLFALQRLGVEAVWTDDPVLLRRADKVIFPGVGEASSAMRYLRQRQLDQVVMGLQQPVLGICLGLQLFCSHTEENDTQCLGIFDVDVKKFPAMPLPIGEKLKVPHMGWNTIGQLQGPLFKGIQAEEYVYFVHSFYAEQHAYMIANTQYGVSFSAALQHKNFYAVQFHPEKSGVTGQKILRNFLEITT